MSAGTGILHSEKNDCVAARGREHTEPVHFVQMWVVPDESGIDARLRAARDRRRAADRRARPGRVGHGRDDGDSAIRIKNRYAALHAARLQPGQSVTLPEAPYLHLFVARGDVTLEGAGDAGRGRRRAVHRDRRPAGDRDRAGAEILVWEMHATLAAA